MAKGSKFVAEKVNVRDEVTNAIIAQLEQGVSPWSKPWSAKGGVGGFPAHLPLRHNGQRYRGINVLILWNAMMQRGYHQPRFMTYNQAVALGGNVRKGEKATKVVYSGAFQKEVEKNGETTEQRIPYMKNFSVFNVEQIDGLAEEYFIQPPVDASEQPVIKGPEEIAHVRDFFAAIGVKVNHGGDRAFFMPSQDRIQMPELKSFNDSVSYYATLAHEHIHWTGTKDRCERKFGARFADQDYAAEELVAELGAAFLCAELGLTLEPRADHAQYLANWLKVLKANNNAIFTAASMAQKACDFINKAAKGEDVPVAEGEEGDDLSMAA